MHLKPKHLFQYPKEAEMQQVRQRSKSIAEFIFPNGIKCTPLNIRKIHEMQEELEKVLFQIVLNRF